MKNRKRLNLLFVALVAFTMIFASSTSVFAEAAKGQAGTEAEPAKAAITKVLNTGAEVKTPDDLAFKFNFTQVKDIDKDSEGNTIKVAQTDVAIPQATATVKTTMTGTTTAPDTTYEVQSGNIFAGVTFPAAGIYVFDVTEAAEAPAGAFTLNNGVYTKHDATNNVRYDITYSQAKYRVYVYVANGAQGPYVKNVGITMTALDGTPGAPGTLPTGKVDGTPGTDATDGSVQTTNSGMKFVNTMKATKTDDPNPPQPGTDPDPEKPGDEKNQALSVSKTVAGDYGDKNYYFEFPVTVTAPVSSAATTLRAYVVDAQGNVVTSADNGAAVVADGKGNNYISVTSGTAITFKLKDGQKVAFTNLPIGSTFNVAETGVSPYKTAVGGSVTVAEGAVGAGFAAQTGSVTETGTKLDVTNTYQDVTPTGIIMNNLPFVALFAAGLGAIAILFVTRRKKNAEEA